MLIMKILGLFILLNLMGCGPQFNGAPEDFAQENFYLDSFLGFELERDLMGSSLSPDDLSSRGVLSPTVYFHPQIQDDGVNCGGKLPVPLRGSKGQTLLNVCPTTFSQCRLQGSCRVQRAKYIYAFNYRDSSPGYSVFIEITNEACFFGYGVKNICLDPFYSVAADLKYHHAGDVIYLPKLKGQVLPSGRSHSGYLIVRDRGGAIKGANRFDFFTGSYDFRDPRNPFARLGLGDKNSKVEFYKVKPTSSPLIQQVRNFPFILPKDQIEL